MKISSKFSYGVLFGISFGFSANNGLEEGLRENQQQPTLPSISRSCSTDSDFGLNGLFAINTPPISENDSVAVSITIGDEEELTSNEAAEAVFISEFGDNTSLESNTPSPFQNLTDTEEENHIVHQPEEDSSSLDNEDGSSNGDVQRDEPEAKSAVSEAMFIKKTSIDQVSFGNHTPENDDESENADNLTTLYFPDIYGEHTRRHSPVNNSESNEFSFWRLLKKVFSFS